MGRNLVTFKIPTTDITPLSVNHYQQMDVRERKFIYHLEEEQDAIRHEHIYSNFEMHFDIPLKAEFTSISFPIEDEVSTIDGHNYYYLFVEDTKYDISDSNSIIQHINNFKTSNKRYPTVKLQVYTHLYIDSGQSEDTTIYIYPPVVECYLEGGEDIFRPSEDIAVGHRIPSGFTTVYQLINEEEADDSSTEIFSDGTASYPDASSTVLVNILMQQVSIKQIRLVSRIYVGLYAGYGAAVSFRLSVNGAQFNTVQASSFVGKMGAWTENSYYTFEAVITSSSDIVKEINSYYKTHKTMPPVEILINTDGEYGAEGAAGAKRSPAKVSQVYLDVVYEDITNIGIFDKVGGKQMPSTAAYKKVGGAWSEITEDECKEVLKNNTIRRG